MNVTEMQTEKAILEEYRDYLHEQKDTFFYIGIGRIGFESNGKNHWRVEPTLLSIKTLYFLLDTLNSGTQEAPEEGELLWHKKDSIKTAVDIWTRIFQVEFFFRLRSCYCARINHINVIIFDRKIEGRSKTEERDKKSTWQSLMENLKICMTSSANHRIRLMNQTSITYPQTQ